jgi:hypothetical protein
VSVPRDRQIQLADLALLLSLIADPPAMAPELSHKDRVRLRGAAQIASPDHAVWADLAAPAAAQARLAHRLAPGNHRPVHRVSVATQLGGHIGDGTGISSYLDGRSAPRLLSTGNLATPTSS